MKNEKNGANNCYLNIVMVNTLYKIINRTENLIKQKIKLKHSSAENKTHNNTKSLVWKYNKILLIIAIKNK